MALRALPLKLLERTCGRRPRKTKKDDDEMRFVVGVITASFASTRTKFADNWTNFATWSVSAVFLSTNLFSLPMAFVRRGLSL
jgi:hypothetical protein